MSANPFTLEWIAKAEEDAAVAERERRIRKNAAPGVVCYHAQQCIEKYLKAVLQDQGRPIPKIHDLAILFDLCDFQHLSLAIDRDGLIRLTRFATRFRYPGESAMPEDAREAVALMRNYRKWIGEFLGTTV